MSDFIKENEDKFEKEKAERLKKANNMELKKRVKNLDRDQAEVVVKQLPTDMLFEELKSRLTDLCDFKAKFEDLAKLESKMKD